MSTPAVRRIAVETGDFAELGRQGTKEIEAPEGFFDWARPERVKWLDLTFEKKWRSWREIK